MQFIKVRKDDDRLAHGLVKSGALEVSDMASRTIRKLEAARNMLDFISVCADHFGGRILAGESSNKLTGSRAKCRILAFEPRQDGSGDFSLHAIGWDAKFPHVWVRPYSIIIERHCIARYIQRVLGSGDIDTAIASICKYLSALIKSKTPYNDGQRVSVSGPEGTLCLVKKDGKLLAKTFIVKLTTAADFCVSVE